jgi:transcriptional regulator with XRE-family HTH domain
MSFGSHLRSLREGAGLSRAEMARRARVPASTLRGWEHDRGFPNLPALLRLAGALGVPVERLAEGVEDPVEEEGEPVPRPGDEADGRPRPGGQHASAGTPGRVLRGARGGCGAVTTPVAISFTNPRRRVGPRRAGDLGLSAQVERTGAENGSTRIHLGVSDRSRV